MIMSSYKVTVRSLIEEDAYKSVNWRNNPAIWKMTKSRPTKTIKLEDELSWIRKVMAEKDSRRFAILADDTYVGNIYLTDINDKPAEYHIFIGEQEFWGKGIARAASERLIDYAKDELKLDSIYLVVHEENIPAVKLYESLGL
jgi:RimJ/RimL family protein N-acetyltransferase